MNRAKVLTSTTALLGGLWLNGVSAETFHEHGTHEHGSATLNIAVQESSLYLQMESPAVNFLDFEHPPTNDEEQRHLDEVKAQLMQPETLFALTAAAGCKAVDIEIESALFGDDAHHEGHESEEHADIQLSYRFDCQSPAQLKAVDLVLFQQFPLVQDVDAQIITDQGQTQIELNPAHTRIDL